MALRSYTKAQSTKIPKPLKPTPSGTACSEKKCPGEMLWREPKESHPEFPKLARADCGKCKWRGWV